MIGSKKSKGCGCRHDIVPNFGKSTAKCNVLLCCLLQTRLIAKTKAKIDIMVNVGQRGVARHFEAECFGTFGGVQCV